MKYEWNPDKNDRLKSERNISFEEIVFHILQVNVWQVVNHPDQRNYPGQRLYFVVINDYVYIVPHIISQRHIFLKTIIPSRKATRDYLKEKGKQK